MTRQANAQDALARLEQLVPHRRPMLLLDRFLSGDRNSARAEVTVRADGLFVEADQGLPAWALLEYFAQTAALIGGLRAEADGEPVVQGMLLGTRRLDCEVTHIPPGTTLELEAETGFVDDNGMGAYHCQTRYKDHVLKCTLMVYAPTRRDQNND